MCKGCPCCIHVNTPPSFKVFWKNKHKRGFSNLRETNKSSGMHKMGSTSKPTTQIMVCVKMYATLYLQHFSPVFDRSCRFCIQYTAIVISSHLRLIRGKTSDMMDALQEQSKIHISLTHFSPALTHTARDKAFHLFTL